MRFILSLLMVGTCVGLSAQETNFVVEVQPEMVAADWDGKPVLRYKYAQVPFKPYIIECFSPSGVTPLMDAPEDHKHHHGVMFAVTVDGSNFWEEGEAPGRQEHVHFGTPRYDAVEDLERAQFMQVLRWLAPNGVKVLDESRTFTLYRGESLDHSLMTWTTAIATVDGKKTAEVTGTHYHGLGVRFHDSMVHEGTFINAADDAGEVVRGSERLARATWCAYQARAEGAEVTWAMFDHPRNPRHPAWWFTMDDPFAYMSATLNLHREPLIIERGAPVFVRYGIALWDGHVTKEQIEAAYQRWLTLEE